MAERKAFVIGSGAREHSLVKALKSTSVEPIDVYCYPANAGIANEAIVPKLRSGSPEDLADFAEAVKIGITIAGPEAILFRGGADVFNKRGLPFFGPTRAAAEIERNKLFSWEFNKAYGIPQPEGIPAYTFKRADEILSGINPRDWVYKYPYEAAGKGVNTARNHDQVRAWLIEVMVDKKFGDTDRGILFQKRVRGPETSAIAICDGTNFKILPSSVDHKAASDGGVGPNTGGMGAYSPDPAEYGMEREIERIFQNALDGSKKEGSPFIGFFYAGLMGRFPRRVLEWNCRMGDPEAQVILPRIKTDLYDLLLKATQGRLNETKLEVLDQAAVCVVIASEGYPDKPITGREVIIPDKIPYKDVIITHAGTKRDKEGRLVSTGGRVINVTAMADTHKTAKLIADEVADMVELEGSHKRHDIASKVTAYI